MTKFDALDVWARDLVDTGRLANTEITILRHGETAYFGQYGFMDIDRQKPLAEGSIFRIYSMTKPIICLAVLILMERGALKLTDPVSKYIPSFANPQVVDDPSSSNPGFIAANRDITLHDLMTHTAGLTYGGTGHPPVSTSYREQGINFSDAYGDLAEVASKVGQCHLYYQPGTRWIYSIANDVLGRIIEVASGQSLDQFFVEHLFKPLEMPDTAFHVTDTNQRRFVSNFEYDADSNLRDCSDQSSDRYLKGGTLLSGGGGLVSTSRDYLKFCQMLLGSGRLGPSRLLSSESVGLMTSNHLPGDLPAMGCPIHGKMDMSGIGYGYGVAVTVDAEKATVGCSNGDFGWGGVANTYFWIDPSEDMIVLFMSQLIPASDMPIRSDLRNHVYRAISK